ncbi:MAG: CARDB domain-containing protein [Thermoplasmata archaeon]
MPEKKFTVFIIGIFLLTSALFIGASIRPAEGAKRDNRINPRVVEGPEDIFINNTVTYRIEIGGAFEAGGELVRASEADNYTLKTESDLDTTIDPLEDESTSTNVFEVNVSAHEEGEGELTFTAYCGKGDDVAYSEKKFSFDAEKPEKTTVKIENPTDTHIEKMKVGLFIDGELKSTETITDLEPDEDREITFQWSKRGLSTGEHTLEVWGDYEPAEDEQSFNQNDLIMSINFQVEEETNTMVYVGIAILAIAISLVVFLWYQSRKRKRRRPW